MGRLGARLVRLERSCRGAERCPRCRRLHLGVALLQQIASAGARAVGHGCQCDCCGPCWEALTRRYEALGGARADYG